MFLEPNINNLRILLTIWVVLSGAIALFLWSSRRSSVGLPLIYLSSLTMVHFFGAIPYAFSTYIPTSQMVLQSGTSLRTTHLGLELTVIGLFSILCGIFVGEMVTSIKPRLQLRRMTPLVKERLPGLLLSLALLFFFVLAPVMRLVPSLGSMANAGAFLAVVAPALACWQAWKAGDNKKVFGVLVAASVALPFTTLIFMGFMGYGTAAAFTLWVFVYNFYRPRWVSTLCLILFIYLGMSLYVNYMASRSAIRASVWQNKSMTARLEATSLMFKNFEFLNPNNNNHLELIDLRLNQNFLVGKCETYMEHSTIPFAHGSTLAVAVAALIPRILWPDKPKTGGSGALVGMYTGMDFAGGTCVGIGQVMEFYINFGIPGIMVGFIVLGIVLRYCDIRAASHLNSGDYWSFTRWFLPALGLMQANGNVSELVGSTAAAAVFVTVLHNVYFEGFYVQTKKKQDVGSFGAGELGAAPVAVPSFRVRK
jgi:hypothetical protein